MKFPTRCLFCQQPLAPLHGGIGCEAHENRSQRTWVSSYKSSFVIDYANKDLGAESSDCVIVFIENKISEIHVIRNDINHLFNFNLDLDLDAINADQLRLYFDKLLLL